MMYLQRGIYWPINPIRLSSDHQIVDRQTLWNERNEGPAGLLPVGLGAGQFGRLEWSSNGEDCYLQYFAPSLQSNECPPEYLLAEMDYAGIDVAVLQNGAMYGFLSDYFADAIALCPERFVGLAQVRENEAHTDDQMAELDRAAEELEMRGLYFQVGGFWVDSFRHSLDESRLRGFWSEVERLGLTVFWDFSVLPVRSRDSYVEQLVRVIRVLERHPEMSSVLVQAFPLSYFAPNGAYELPAEAGVMAELPNFAAEVTLPISVGGLWDYPYREAWLLVRHLYDTFGPNHLVWGSDMPNVIRFCTYRQSLDYLRRYCDFISPADMDLIVGGTAARLLRLQVLPGHT